MSHSRKQWCRVLKLWVAAGMHQPWAANALQSRSGRAPARPRKEKGPGMVPQAWVQGEIYLQRDISTMRAMHQAGAS
jgi:hypothetical protein